MCGIAGLLQPKDRVYGRDQAIHLVEGMNRCIAHRGPDADGTWADPDGRCVLGQRRLSIIDTSDAGRQPFASHDERWWLTFNGEIYNFQDVRAELESKGVRFRGRTDTEVLVEAIAFWGMDALPRLDGMYAFAAYDTASRSLFLARDPFGEKPLYYAELASGALAFASELQALEQLPGFDHSLSVDAVAEVLSFQYIGAPRSIYSGTKKLPAGHWMRVDAAGDRRIEQHFQFRPGVGGFTDRPMAELADELEDLLTRSLKRRLFADVPLGAFLSGGVDSSTVCALVRRKLDTPLHTFSMGFEGSPDSEHEIARQFAAHLGTEHRDRLVDPHGTDFLRNIGSVLDEPNADSSCLPTYLLSGFAREHVTVALSGDGGDELFGGYGRYFATLDESQRQAAGELQGWRPGETYYGNRILVSSDAHLQSLFGFMPRGFASHVGGLREQLDSAPKGRLLSRMRQSDAANYMPGAVLPKVDRMSMQHALEVRTPFLNVELARFAERLPDDHLVRNGRGKLILREIAYRYLPRHLVDLPKQGFGLPMSDWARTGLLNLASELLGGEDARVLPLFGRKGLSDFMARQSSAGGFSTYQIWAVLMLESWLRHHPAKVPDLSERRPYEPPAAGRGALNAVQASEKVWLVTRGDAKTKSDGLLDERWRTARPELVNRVIDLVGEDRQTEKSALRVSLPDWGNTLPDDATEQFKALDGAVLAFLDPETQENIDYHELYKLSVVGVRHIVMGSRYFWDRIHEIDVNPKKLPQRMWDNAVLATKAVAVVANRRAFRLPLRPLRFWVTPTSGCTTHEEIPRLGVSADVDLYDRFMMFEGMRQLPPVHNAHADIGTKGGGRYSIWNKNIFFSTTSSVRLYTHPFWLVEKTEANKHRLQFSPRPHVQPQAIEPSEADFAGLYRADAANRGFTLRPRDKVVVCTHGLPPGGAERQWVYLAVGLKRAGYQVHFVMYDDPTGHNAHYLPMLEAAGVPIHAVAQQPTLKFLSVVGSDGALAQFIRAKVVQDIDRLTRLVAVFKEIGPKVVYAQLDDPNLYAGLAGLLADVPRVVLSFRNYNPTHFDYIFKDWYKHAYELIGRSERAVFTGNFEGANRDYEDWIGLKPGRAVCIPNAVNRDDFPTVRPDDLGDLRQTLGIEPDQQIVLGVFRLSGEKNPRLFIDVCCRVIQARPRVRALLVGMGPLGPSLQEEVESRGMSHAITFLGRRTDVSSLMSLSDLLLLTSDQEGMPNVVLEAQMMGLPVVATDAGGTRNAMIAGETGLLCPVGDAVGLAAACGTLLDDPAKARRMGDDGAKHASTDFSVDGMSRSYAEVAGAERVSATAGNSREAEMLHG